MPDPCWHQPTSLEEALDLLAGGDARPVGGGVEIMLSRQPGFSDRAQPETLVALDGIAALHRFVAHPRIGLDIGAALRLNRIAADVWIAKRWAALHEAIEQISPPQILNMGTLAGNLCAGQPLYDLATALAAHGAVLVLRGPQSERLVPVTDFYDADGAARLAPGEIVTAIRAPKPGQDAGSAFRKIMGPVAGDPGFARVAVAASVALDPSHEVVTGARVAVGGFGPAPLRLYDCEAELPGLSLEEAGFAARAARAADTLDLPGGSEAKRLLGAWIPVLLRDALEQAASRARSRHDPFDDASEMIGASK